MMGTSTPQPEPAAPTAQDAEAVMARALEAAQRAETAAQQLEAARGAAGQEAQARFPGMPAEVVKQISDAAASQVVDMLRKEFELSGPGSSGVGSGNGLSPDAAAAAAAGSTAAPDATAGTAPAPPDAQPSGFRNLAHRILGY